MKAIFKKSTLVFRTLKEKVLTPIYDRWATKYYINNSGLITKLDAYVDGKVAEPVNIEGYSKLVVSNIVGGEDPNPYACPFSIWSVEPMETNWSDKIVYHKTFAQLQASPSTSVEIELTSDMKWLAMGVNQAANSSVYGTPIYTLIP